MDDSGTLLHEIAGVFCGSLPSLRLSSWRHQRKRINSYRLVVNALLPLILYPSVFLFSAYGQVEAHMAVALSRLLVHNGLNAVLLVSTAVAILFVGPDIPASGRSDEAWAQ